MLLNGTTCWPAHTLLLSSSIFLLRRPCPALSLVGALQIQVCCGCLCGSAPALLSVSLDRGLKDLLPTYVSLPKEGVGHWSLLDWQREGREQWAPLMSESAFHVRRYHGGLRVRNLSSVYKDNTGSHRTINVRQKVWT